MPINIDFDKALTKDLILSKVSQEEIFAKYGVPVQSGVFRSPLRSDRHPTCNFYRKGNGKLYLRDHAGYFWGDCFDLVMKNQGLSFGKALQRIAEDFNLTDSVVLGERRPAQSIYIPPQEAAQLRIKRREWNTYDLRFWGRWGFKQETLELFHISPIDRAWVNEEQIYAYRSRIGYEAYAYHFGQYDYKFYFPQREVGRFRHNNSWILQGYLQLPVSGEFIVITKSLKDVAKLYEYGIPAVAPMSETTLPALAHMEELAERFGRIIVFYDNDWPGRRQMVRFRQKYGTQFLLDFICMPQGQPKDFTDYYELRGNESTISLIEHVKTELL